MSQGRKANAPHITPQQMAQGIFDDEEPEEKAPQTPEEQKAMVLELANALGAKRVKRKDKKEGKK